MLAPATAPPSLRRSFVAGSVYVFERLMPDPFVLAIGLTLVVALAAFLFAPNGAPTVIVSSWYTGVFGILGFAFQMILILVTGHALAHAPPVQLALKALVAPIESPGRAVVTTFLVAAVASWLNWGFGLVIGAVLAREVAKRVRLDFGWLVAAAYSGWVIWASGPSSSIALSQATHGNALNVVEKLTGMILPFSQTVFTAFNLVPTALVVIVLPFVFLRLRPREDEMQVFVPGDEAEAPARMRPDTPAGRLNHSRLLSLFFAGGAAAFDGPAWGAGSGRGPGWAEADSRPEAASGRYKARRRAGRP